MRKLLHLVMLLSIPISLQGQGIRYDNIALTTKNTAYGMATVPVAGAVVAVCSQPAVTASVPCSPLVQLYSNTQLTNPIANPTAADAKGNYSFYYNPSDGPLTVQISGTSVQTYVMPDQSGPLVSTSMPSLSFLYGQQIQSPSNGDLNISAGLGGTVHIAGLSLLSGSGTTNAITKWTGTYTLGDSSATDDGTTFTVNDPYLVAHTINADTVNAGNISTTGSGSNGIISGGLVYWTGTGYDYIVQQTVYQIGGTTYSAPQTPETLSAADPTNPRIDVFFVDDTGAVGVITGTPSANPVEPAIDPTTQISLGFVLVAAGSSAPAGASVTDIYLENAGPPTEWTCSAGTSWNCADTSNPFAGTYNIKSDGSSATGLLTLSTSPAVSVSGNNLLSFELKSAANWVGKDEVWVTFYNGSSAVGSTVFTSTSTYGWNGQGGTYELVAVPLSAFNLGTSMVDSIKIKWNKGGNQTTGISIYLDNIQLEQNSVSGGGTGSSGTVSSVGLQGDGVVYNSIVSGSPVTSSGVFKPSLVSVPAGYFLRGPVGSLGTNIAVRQQNECAGTATIINCTFSSPVTSGDGILVLQPSGTNTSNTVTDTLGTTLTGHALGGINYIYFGIASASGSDTVSFASATQAPYSIIIVEITGVAAYQTGSSFNGVIGAGISTHTLSLTPSAITDAVLDFSSIDDSAIPSNDLTVNPLATQFLTYSDTTNGVSGNGWLFAPGSTSALNTVFTWNIPGGHCGGGCNFGTWSIDFSQSATAGAAPWVAGKIRESDLPASAVSAIQSVQTFNMTPSTTVIDPTTPNVGTSLVSGSITMPTDGCPCRVEAHWTVYWDESGSGDTFDFWISDGTNQFAATERNVVSAAGPGANGSGVSPVSYSNNQSVTFTLYGASGSAANGTVRKAAANTVNTIPTHMTLMIMQSRN
jgi:hypothetical protein